MSENSLALGFGGNNKHNNSISPTGSNNPTGSSWPTPGANDGRLKIEGYGLDGLAGIAVMILQAALAEQQYELARSYYKTNKKDFDFWQANYSSRVLSHAQQAFTTPFYTPDYYPMTGAALAQVKQYDEKWFQTRRRLHRYALGHQRHIDYQFYNLRRRAVFSSLVTGRRVEDARKDWKDDQIQTHKVQALNIGIALGNIARQGLAQATATKEKAFDELGSRLGGLANGLFQRKGYESGVERANQIMNQKVGETS